MHSQIDYRVRLTKNMEDVYVVFAERVGGEDDNNNSEEVRQNLQDYLQESSQEDTTDSSQEQPTVQPDDSETLQFEVLKLSEVRSLNDVDSILFSANSLRAWDPTGFFHVFINNSNCYPSKNLKLTRVLTQDLRERLGNEELVWFEFRFAGKLL